MKIPNADRAVVDIRKLRDYCLDAGHSEGKHKARLFSATLGMKASDAEELRLILLQIIVSHEARLGRRDGYGQRYVIDFMLEWRDRQAMVRSSWIIEDETDLPRLTSCYPV